VLAQRPCRPCVLVLKTGSADPGRQALPGAHPDALPSLRALQQEAAKVVAHLTELADASDARRPCGAPGAARDCSARNSSTDAPQLAAARARTGNAAAAEAPAAGSGRGSLHDLEAGIGLAGGPASRSLPPAAASGGRAGAAHGVLPRLRSRSRSAKLEWRNEAVDEEGDGDLAGLEDPPAAGPSRRSGLASQRTAPALAGTGKQPGGHSRPRVPAPAAAPRSSASGLVNGTKGTHPERSHALSSASHVEADTTPAADRDPTAAPCRFAASCGAAQLPNGEGAAGGARGAPVGPDGARAAGGATSASARAVADTGRGAGPAAGGDPALESAAAGALAAARALVGRAVRACEEAARRRGYTESSPHGHEAYTDRHAPFIYGGVGLCIMWYWTSISALRALGSAAFQSAASHLLLDK